MFQELNEDIWFSDAQVHSVITPKEKNKQTAQRFRRRGHENGSHKWRGFRKRNMWNKNLCSDGMWPTSVEFWRQILYFILTYYFDFSYLLHMTFCTRAKGCSKNIVIFMITVIVKYGILINLLLIHISFRVNKPVNMHLFTGNSSPVVLSIHFEQLRLQSLHLPSC